MSDASLRLRRAGFAGGAAFFLLVTALLLPWWVVSSHTEGVAGSSEAVYPLGSDKQLANHWAQLTTGILVGVAVVLLFVRVASRAWDHEPRTWRRDLAIVAGMVFLALLSGMLWPTAEAQLPFWGGRTYLLDPASGAELTVTALPGLGWWLALLGMLLLGWAWWASRGESGKAGG